MSATSSRETSPASSNRSVARSGSSVWTWIFSVLLSPTTSTESPSRSSRAIHGPGSSAFAGDGEVRAVAVGRGRVLRMGDARGRVMLERRRIGAAQRGDHAREDDRQAVAAGVHDARLAQDRQQVRAALDRRLARVQRVLEHVGEHLVLGRVVDAMLEPRLVHVRDLTRRARGHLADHREDRALGGIADAAVRAIGGARHRGGDQHRVDELAGAADELLGGAADQLARGSRRSCRARPAARRGRRCPRSGRARSRRCPPAWRGCRARSARRAASAPCCRPCRRRRPGRR